jgi:hypothetical protein
MAELTNATTTFIEIHRASLDTKKYGYQFCGCCGSRVGLVNTHPDKQSNVGYTCWLSNTDVGASFEDEYNIETLPLDDGTFLIIKINTRDSENDY